jgi:hypothetical protein
MQHPARKTRYFNEQVEIKEQCSFFMGNLNSVKLSMDVSGQKKSY